MRHMYSHIHINIYVSLHLRMQNAVPAQPCVGKLGISLVLLNFLHCNFRMQELPTNKANFLIKTTQDFNSSRHAAPHLPIVFTDNIILYFNYKLFVLHLFKRSHNGTSPGGVYRNVDIFVKCGYFYAVLISPLFSNMASKRQFRDSDL